MGEARTQQLDEWGHVETHRVKHDVWIGVLDRNGEGRILVSIGAPPDRGYDAVYGYATVEDALSALSGWDYDTEPEPPGHIRNYQTDPIVD